MSYLVLARKYRPQTFEDVVGQKPVVKTLQNSLIKERVAHAILFSGVRGVGKTTLARIMAKAINCEAEKEHRPCNSCRSCTEITGGQSLDLHEIDGASNRGIQEIRELKEKIRFLPTISTFKIIIIDEVHMLTTEAFNALLKTLEEPPQHVYFMFATTELHKIPITILSRCQKYELKRVSASEMVDHFTMIAEQEQRGVEPSALSLIVREAGGSIRDGLSLLDQMFSFGETQISQRDVIQVLGLTDRQIITSITEALLADNRREIFLLLEKTFEYGVDIKRFSADLLDNFRTLLLIKIGELSELIDLPNEEIAFFQEIADKFTFETIHLKMNLLMEGMEQLRYSSQPRLALETTFLKMIEAGNVTPVAELIGKIDLLLDSSAPEEFDRKPQSTSAEKKTVADSSLAVDEVAPVAEAQTQQKAPETAQGKQEQPPPASTTSSRTEEPPPPEDHHFPEAINVDAQTEEQEEPRQPPPPPPQQVEEKIKIKPHTRDIRRDWMEFAEYVKDRKVWMSKDLQLADSAKEVDGELHLHYSDPATCSLLRSKENKKRLTEFVLDFFQKDLTVRFIVPEQNGNSDDDNENNSPHKKRQQLAQDPLVQMTMEIFNGQVGDIRIGPRSR